MNAYSVWQDDSDETDSSSEYSRTHKNKFSDDESSLGEPIDLKHVNKAGLKLEDAESWDSDSSFSSANQKGVGQKITLEDADDYDSDNSFQLVRNKSNSKGQVSDKELDNYLDTTTYDDQLNDNFNRPESGDEGELADHENDDNENRPVGGRSVANSKYGKTPRIPKEVAKTMVQKALARASNKGLTKEQEEVSDIIINGLTRNTLKEKQPEKQVRIKSKSVPVKPIAIGEEVPSEAKKYLQKSAIEAVKADARKEADRIFNEVEPTEAGIDLKLNQMIKQIEKEDGVKLTKEEKQAIKKQVMMKKGMIRKLRVEKSSSKEEREASKKEGQKMKEEMQKPSEETIVSKDETIAKDGFPAKQGVVFSKGGLTVKRVNKNIKISLDGEALTLKKIDNPTKLSKILEEIENSTDIPESYKRGLNARLKRTRREVNAKKTAEEAPKGVYEALPKTQEASNIIYQQSKTLKRK